MGDEGRVGVVADDDAADAFGAAVGVEGVVLLLDVLALTGSGALADGFGEEGEEFADAVRGDLVSMVVEGDSDRG